jgi:release factor glutamine methyltransferase
VKVVEALHKYSSLLRQHGLDEADIDAKVLLCHILKIKSSQLFAEPDRIISANELSSLEDLINQRINRIPVAYIVKHIEFFCMELYVNSSVLIPRPETELLVEEAIELSNIWFKNNKEKIKIADVGTGSGAVALALAKNIPDSKIYAIDKSEVALQVANTNADRHNLSHRIVFVKGYLLQQITDKLDIVVANLPYIPVFEIPLLPKEISEYEPQEALNGGESGITIIAELIKQLPGRIAAGGTFLLEIGINQEEPVQSLVRHYFPDSNINLIKDLAGINRIIKVETKAF